MKPKQEEALRDYLRESIVPLIEDVLTKKLGQAITFAKEELAAPVQEHVAWKWHQAPVKTSWGHDTVVADLAIDKDNTVSVYCERDYTAKVEAMFTPPAAQRQWVGTVDCIGLALDLEVQAKRVESQTIERAMLAAANGLRIIDEESKA